MSTTDSHCQFCLARGRTFDVIRANPSGGHLPPVLHARLCAKCLRAYKKGAHNGRRVTISIGLNRRDRRRRAKERPDG